MDRERMRTTAMLAAAAMMMSIAGNAHAAQNATAAPHTGTTTTANKYPATKERTPHGAISAIMAAPRATRKSGMQKWLRVDITKAALTNTTEPEFREFCEEVVSPCSYGWVTIICGDGTGIQFAGSFAGAAEYGKIDRDGQMEEPLGYITLTDKGYSYLDADSAE